MKAIQLLMMNKKKDIKDVDWDLSTASYDNKSFNVSSQDSTPKDVHFKPDGFKMFVIGSASKSVYQYSLSTAWDVSTASYDNKSFLASSEVNDLMSITFKQDGEIMFLGSRSGKVAQYNLSTAWDVSTASYNSINYQTSISGVIFTSTHFELKNDGTKLYVTNHRGGAVSRSYQYSLSTAWDVSTASYDNKEVAQNNYPGRLNFQPNGKRMFNNYNYSYSDRVFQFSLSTAWDISSASKDKEFNIYTNSGEFTENVFFKKSGGKFYVVSSRDKDIKQYSI